MIILHNYVSRGIISTGMTNAGVMPTELWLYIVWSETTIILQADSDGWVNPIGVTIAIMALWLSVVIDGAKWWCSHSAYRWQWTWRYSMWCRSNRHTTFSLYAVEAFLVLICHLFMGGAMVDMLMTATFVPISVHPMTDIGKLSETYL